MYRILYIARIARDICISFVWLSYGHTMSHTTSHTHSLTHTWYSTISACTPLEDVPLLDLQAEDTTKLAEDIISTCKHYGFMQFKNHGVDPALVSYLYIYIYIYIYIYNIYMCMCIKEVNNTAKRGQRNYILVHT